MDPRSERSIAELRDREPERGYGCPCGKTYLSYPALFTHVKQKHQGKPPGKLVKPKTGKVRGRPKTRINPEDIELMEIIAKVEHDVPELVEDYTINYDREFERSEGSITCQDAATQFLDIFEDLSANGITVISCFLNQVKAAVGQQFGEEYWTKEKPAEIIDVANTLYMKHQASQSEQCLISKETFKELIYHFFEWLYANKFTDHRLMKRGVSEEQGTKPNE